MNPSVNFSETVAATSAAIAPTSQSHGIVHTPVKKPEQVLQILGGGRRPSIPAPLGEPGRHRHRRYPADPANRRVPRASPAPRAPPAPVPGASSARGRREPSDTTALSARYRGHAH
ncbi:hypothetical protein GCM10009605_24000 [Nocardiopsis composta]